MSPSLYHVRAGVLQVGGHVRGLEASSSVCPRPLPLALWPQLGQLRVFTAVLWIWSRRQQIHKTHEAPLRSWAEHSHTAGPGRGQKLTGTNRTCAFEWNFSGLLSWSREGEGRTRRLRGC